jgi:hypothetical protein
MLTQRSKLPERPRRTSEALGARKVGRDLNLNAMIGAHLGCRAVFYVVTLSRGCKRRGRNVQRKHRTRYCVPTDRIEPAPKKADQAAQARAVHRTG